MLAGSKIDTEELLLEPASELLCSDFFRDDVLFLEHTPDFNEQGTQRFDPASGGQLSMPLFLIMSCLFRVRRLCSLIHGGTFLRSDKSTASDSDRLS